MNSILNWLPPQVLPASTAWLGTANTASEDPRDPPERPVTLARRDRRVSRATARQPCAWPPQHTPHPDYRRRVQSKDPVSRRPSPQQGRDVTGWRDQFFSLGTRSWTRGSEGTGSGDTNRSFLSSVRHHWPASNQNSLILFGWRQRQSHLKTPKRLWEERGEPTSL